jgi:hypothetical protein
MPIEPLTGQSKENVASLNAPGIDADTADAEFRGAAGQFSSAGMDDKLQGTWLHAQPDPRNESASFDETVSNGSGLPNSTSSKGIS